MNDVVWSLRSHKKVLERVQNLELELDAWRYLGPPPRVEAVAARRLHGNGTKAEVRTHGINSFMQITISLLASSFIPPYWSMVEKPRN